MVSNDNDISIQPKGNNVKEECHTPREKDPLCSILQILTSQELDCTVLQVLKQARDCSLYPGFHARNFPFDSEKATSNLHITVVYSFVLFLYFISFKYFKEFSGCSLKNLQDSVRHFESLMISTILLTFHAFYFQQPLWKGQNISKKVFNLNWDLFMYLLIYISIRLERMGGKLLLFCIGEYIWKYILSNTNNDTIIGIAFDLEIQLLGTDPEMILGKMWQKESTRMFTATMLLNETFKQPKYP